ncbi:MAG TPA: 3-carboxy-cis,cis-muconate cycloisomerase [Thermoleophilaceae bacterium]
MAGELFGPIFVPDPVREAVSDRAWLQAMLDFEAALAVAEARARVIPLQAAEAIGAACRADRFDAGRIARKGRGSGNPAAPLASALRAALPDEAARWVHWGATSQDVLDTAAMLVARRALDLVLADLDGVATACARLADAHRATPMAGRTLLQQAVPTTFGLKAAGWLVAVSEATDRLRAIQRERLAVELGGAAGTLSALGDQGPHVLALLAEELGLAEPVVPWHTARGRVAELGAELALTAGVLAKIALDVVLLAQTEVGEVAEAAGGGSSAMPHKRNPVAATLVRACAPQVQAQAGVLVAAMAQEHERAAGAWHSEWEALSRALELTGGAGARAREMVEGLRIDPERMRANLDATGGLLMAEHVMVVLTEKVGGPEASRLVEAAASRARDEGLSLGDALATDPGVELSDDEIRRALDPESYLGAADAFVQRALDLVGWRP